MSSPASTTLHGVLLMTAAVACFATLDTMTQIISGTVPVVMALWARYAVQMMLTGVVLLPRRGRTLLRTHRLVLQVLRAATLLLSSVCVYFSLRYLPVGEVTAVAMLTPMVIAVVAAALLGEYVSVLRWAFLLLGFAGAIIVVRPGAAGFEPAMLLPLGIVVTSAAYQLITSVLTRADGAGTTHFLTGLIATGALTVALPLGWAGNLYAIHWLLLGAMGLAGTVGHLFLILAYSRAPVAVLTPFLYLQIAFAMIGGWLIFGYVPDGWALLGVAAIAISGLGGTAAMFYERRAAVVAV